MLSLLVMAVVASMEPSRDEIPVSLDDDENELGEGMHTYELTQSHNFQRQDAMLKACAQMRNTMEYKTVDELNTFQMSHLLVDRKHKFLYCYVPKVGSGNL